MSNTHRSHLRSTSEQIAFILRTGYAPEQIDPAQPERIVAIGIGQSLSEDMALIHQECADLIADIDQDGGPERNWGWLYVHTRDVPEAVRRVNELGFETDQDLDTPA